MFAKILSFAAVALVACTVSAAADIKRCTADGHDLADCYEAGAHALAQETDRYLAQLMQKASGDEERKLMTQAQTAWSQYAKTQCMLEYLAVQSVEDIRSSYTSQEATLQAKACGYHQVEARHREVKDQLENLGLHRD